MLLMRTPCKFILDKQTIRLLGLNQKQTICLPVWMLSRLFRVANPDLLVVIQNSQNNTTLWLIDYKEFYQGRTINVFDEHESHSLYYTLRSALINFFSSNNYAFIQYPDRLYLRV